MIALGAVLTTSCADDELEVLNPADTDETTEIGGYPVTISASTPTSDTKVAIDGINVSWEADDSLVIAKYPTQVLAKSIQYGSYRRIAAMDGQPNGNKANFLAKLGTANGANGNEFIYASSPVVRKANGDEVTFLYLTADSSVSYTFTPKMIQDHKYAAALALDSESISPYVLMYGRSNIEHSRTDVNASTIGMTMKHLMTYIDFNISGLSGKAVDSLVISTPSLLASVAKYQLHAKPKAPELIFTTASDISVRLIDSEGGKGITPTDEFTVRVAACIAAPTQGKVWTINAFKDGVFVAVGNTKAATLNFEAGSLYKPSITLAPLGTAELTTSVADLQTITTAASITKLKINGGGALSTSDFEFIKSRMVNLKELDISATTTVEIANEVFNGFSLLEKITFNTTGELKTIGKNAFKGTSLTAVALPEGVETIMEAAFMGTKLTEFTFPNSVSSLGRDVLNACTSLATITFKPKSKLKAILTSLAGGSGITSISFPDSLTTLGYEALTNCESLITIEIPASVNIIGNRAFFGCSRLTSVVFKSPKLESLGDVVFSGCMNLETITFEGEVPKIEASTFVGSRANQSAPLKNIYVPSEHLTAYQGTTGTANSLLWKEYKLWNNADPSARDIALTSIVKSVGK